MTNFFVYGTLMCEDIMMQVAGPWLTREKATLPHYRCHRVKGETYPAIVSTPGHTTPGILYRGISENGCAALDQFEGPQYRRKRVLITLENQSEQEAYAYEIAPSSLDDLDSGDWNFDDFLKRGKTEFIARYVGFDKIR